MKETKCYKIVGCLATLVLVMAFCLICVRIISKTLLVDRMHLNSEILQVIADYTLADWMDISEKNRRKNLR